MKNCLHTHDVKPTAKTTEKDLIKQNYRINQFVVNTILSVHLSGSDYLDICV